MADSITALRIVCSLLLLPCRALSPCFYGLYIIAGFSDVLDGAVARRTNTVSDFGARLDSLADFMLVAVCLIKLMPVLDIPIWLYVWTAAIAAVRLINIVSGYAMRNRLVAVHSAMNKVAGALLFALPLTLGIIDLRVSGAVACAAATLAAVQEGHFIRTGRES